MRSATPLLLCLALIASGLAGCLTPAPLQGSEATTDGPNPRAMGGDPWTGLSKPLFDVLPLRRVDVPSFDGTPINAYVAMPDLASAGAEADPRRGGGSGVDNGTKVPVIVNYSPYWSNAEPPAREGGDAFSRWLIDFFVPRGYAVVLQSVRGTGESGGCFEMGGVKEQRDSYVTTEYWGTRDWSNGNVGLIGKSYDGTTPHEAAITNPPHLRTIVPVSAISDWYLYLYKNGVAYDYGIKQGHTFNARYSLMVDWGVGAGFGMGDTTPSRENVENWPSSACGDLAVSSAEGVGTGSTGDYTAYWRERGYVHHVDDITASVFFIHGLQDWNVKPDHIQGWYNAIDAPKKAWLGQWGHHYPLRDDWNLTLLRWFDSELKGLDTGVHDEPPVQVQDSTGQWRHEADWPPSRAVTRSLYLDVAGHMGDHFIDDDGYPRTVEWTDNPALTPAPPGEADHFAGFATDVLEAPLHVSGVPAMEFVAVSDRPNTHFVALLYDVSPGGEWEAVNHGFLDARHRDSLERSEPLVPGEPTRVTFDLFPMDHVFQPGHRVGLALASSLPRFISDDGAVATNSITLGGDDPARLTLPTVDAVSLEAPQPRTLPVEGVPGNVG